MISDILNAENVLIESLNTDFEVETVESHIIEQEIKDAQEMIERNTNIRKDVLQTFIKEMKNKLIDRLEYEKETDDTDKYDLEQF